MSKNVDLYKAANEAEAKALADMLNDQGVDAQAINLSSSAYPNIVYDGWGVVRVPDSDLEKARALLSEWLSHDLSEAEEGPDVELPGAKIALDSGRARGLHVVAASKKFFFGFVLLCSLVTNGILVGKVTNPPPATAAYDADGNMTAEFVYRDGSSIPVETLSLDRQGRVRVRFEDDKADGWPESAAVYDAEGARIQELFDRDEDGVFEEATTNRGLVRDSDRDGDGLFDLSVSDGRYLEDTDRDGFFETSGCVRDGVFVPREPLRCTAPVGAP